MTEPDTCFSLSMPSHNNTIMLFIPAARPETPAPSWPGAPGRRFAVPPIWPAWIRQRVFERGWANGMEDICWRVPLFSLIHCETSCPPDANEMMGANSEKQHQGKMDTKKGWEGRRPTKAAQNCGSFQITAAVSVNQASSFNNVRPLQAELMSSLLYPAPVASTSSTPLPP